MANVIFKVGLRAQFDALTTKDANTLYWLPDTQELFKGDVLFGVGANATEQAAGLMSAEDKVKLNQIVSTGIINLTPIDASVAIADGENGKTIGVQISKNKENTLTLNSDGLYVTSSDYSIEKMPEASDGYSATYRLKKTVDGSSSYVGAEINIPKDMVVQSGSVKTVTEADQPYAGAQVGDIYIELVLSDSSASHIYIPAKNLIDTSNFVTQEIVNADGGKAIIWNETSGGGAQYVSPDGGLSFVGVNNGGLDGMMAQIYADKQNEDGSWVGSRINVYHDHIYYTSLAAKQSGKENNAAECEIATKGDIAAITAYITWQEM